MKDICVLIDTNIIVDVFLHREPFVKDSKKVIGLCKTNEVRGFVAAHSITDAFYLLRKEYTLIERRRAMLDVCRILTVVSLDESKLVCALKNEYFADFEDCLQAECAISVNADYIITRNPNDFAHSLIPAITPQEFLRGTTASNA